MGAVTARLLDELGYDPDDPVDPDAPYNAAPALADVDLARDVPAGAIVRARDGARAVAVARLRSGRLVVVDDVCPHDGGRISDGFVDGERLVCARHGWELEVQGGRCRRVRACKLRE
jgi:phenylpropionate dioxygenase-like ring-hydroxylating dioxygenase large terminal subunit